VSLSKVLIAVAITAAVIAAAASTTVLGVLLAGTLSKGNEGAAVGNVLVPSTHSTYAASGTQGYVLKNAITTSATATVYVVPSRVIISLSIETPRPYMNATQAYEDVAIRANELVSKLKSLNGVIYIQTLSVRLNPQYEWSKDGKVFKGYVASYSLITEVEVSAVSKVIAEAVKVSTDTIKGISFTVPEEELEKAKEQALRNAVNKVYEKARVMAEELNLTLGKLIYLTTEYSTSDYILRYVKEVTYAAETGGMPEIPIEVGKGFPVVAVVHAAFEIVQE